MRRRFRNIARRPSMDSPAATGTFRGPPCPHPSRLLIVAVSGRALAQSAGRAGYRPVVLDLFADRDTRAASSVCRPINIPGTLRIDAARLLDAARSLAPGAGLVYGSGFEGRPALIDRLSRGRALSETRPRPWRASETLPDFSIASPARNRAPGGATHSPARPKDWLLKRPGAAGRNRGDSRERGAPAAGADYYQRIESGDSLSATFLADGRRARVLGFNRQWTAPGPDGLTCMVGAVGGLTLRPRLRREIEDALDALVAETGLVGLNGLDFILRRAGVAGTGAQPAAHGHVRAVRPGLPRRTAPMAPAGLRRRAAAPRGGASRRACPRGRAR